MRQSNTLQHCLLFVM